MSSESLTSRFFTTDDKRLDTVVFPLPAAWWSRPYEYAWAAEFCKPTDVVLDAACGVCHPFKFWLADKCKVVHAVDKDERINDLTKIENAVNEVGYPRFDTLYNESFSNSLHGINFKQADITELPYKTNMFDRIFCISVIEHLPSDDRLKTLKEFRRVLKNSGQIILTADYPDASIDNVEAMANEAGLKLVGEKDSSLPANAICLKNHGLYCFRMVLIKKKDGE